ncbi:MAG: MBL fold metallo-hydrolase, partial [Methanobacteriaceae archaeon]|nr:MBL fold metallo-hydrolase [Methanobacteriaceae archaeon]
MVEGRGYDSNIYVFDDVMVDTGTGENIDYLFDSLRNSDISVEDLSLIVNTHNHFDHVGGNRYLDLEVAMHREDALPFEKGDEMATAAVMFGKSMGKMKVDFKLEEGDRIGKFEVLHTPGHSRGGICLWDGETLISGDTVFAGGGFGRVDLGGNLEDMINSLERLSKLEIKNLL